MKSTGKWLRGSTGTCVLGMAVSAGLLAAPTEANVTISSATTKNMTCSAGACSPTAKSAVLNVSSLKSMLKSGSTTVTTTGSGVQANNIVVDASLTWSSANTLTLTALQNITVMSPISVTGKGGLTLNDAGIESLAFYNGANVTFANLTSSLVINGNTYGLVDSVAGLATAADANPNGDFALAANYDASGDGTYSSAPVQNRGNWFTGVFEGLGNTISNLTIVDPTASAGCDGLIFSIYSPIISNFGMVNVSITSTGDQGANGAGGIVCGANSGGLIWRSYATGTISMGRLDGAGGLAAANINIVQSWANVAISGGQGSGFGGLTTGGPGMVIQQSFSMGRVSCTVGFCQLGGLSAGGAGSGISDSYSVGDVTDGGPGGDDSYIGGLLSNQGGGAVVRSYAAGKVTTPDSGCSNSTDCVGGLYGMDSYNSNLHAYWDKTTDKVAQAAGNEGTDPGTKGLSNKTFIAQLPKGFSPKVWAENPNINGGLPYLIANPPPN